MRLIDDELDALYEMQDCDECPYRCPKCDSAGCVVDKMKEWLEELKDLRNETDDQKTVIEELLQTIDKYGIDLEKED